MSFRSAGLILLTLTVFVYCDGSSDTLLVERDMSDLIKNFELCDVKCNGKNCECCQKLKAPWNVEVCGSSSLRTAEKLLDLTLKVDGETFVNTTMKMDRLLNFCIPVKTKGGQLGICMNTTLADNKSSPSAIDICLNVDLNIEGVNFVRVSFNCAKFDGEMQIEGEVNKGLKTYGYVKETNGEQLARFVQRIVIGK